MVIWKKRKATGLRLVVLVMGMAAWSAQPALARFNPQPCKNAFSPEQEIVEGQKAKAQVYKTMPVLPDSSPVTRYVQELGARLVARAPGPKWPFEFHVVNVADVNAFALPGGPIFVNLGTIQAAETEAQLAGVMAHEISHVVQRHATCNITKQQTPGLLLGLGQVAAGILLPGAAGALTQGAIGLGGQLGFTKMSRDAEKQADLMGTDILYDAGYDPRAMPQFFEVIQGKYGEGGAQWLSDHPNPGNRIGYVQDEIDTLPHRDNPIKTTAAFTALHKQVVAMRPYTAQEVQSGAWKSRTPNEPVPGGAQSAAIPAGTKPVDFTPNGKWKELSDTAFVLSYPENWQVFDGPGTAVTVAPGGGVTPTGGGDNAVIYGALIDGYTPQSAADLAGATRQLAATLAQGNNGLQTVSGPDDVLVNKQPGKSVEFRNPAGSVGGSPEHDWLVALQRQDGSLTYVVFIAPEKDFAKLRPSFETMLRSFRLKQ